MDDTVIANFSHQLSLHPENWDIRAHLAALYEQRGELQLAAQLMTEAPALPSSLEHLQTAIRLLTPVNPGAALPFLQELQAQATTAAAQASPSASAPLRGNKNYISPRQQPPLPIAEAPLSSSEKNASYSERHLADHVELERSKPVFKFGASRLAVSIGVHVALLAIAATWVISKMVVEKKEDLKFDAEPPRTSALKGNEANVKLAKKKSSSSAPSAAKRILSSAPSKISLPAIETNSTITDTSLSVMSGMGGAGMGLGLGGLGGNGPGGAGIGGGGKGNFMGGLSMDSRCSKGDREKRIRESGGDPKTEQAIGKALAWFKSQQSKENGSWGRAYPASMTGLVLLSYLGHCETPDSSTEYGKTVEDGIMYLVELAQKNTEKNKGDLTKIRFSTADPTTGAAAYEHGIATYALAEAYSMTRYGRKRIPGLKEAVMQGVDIIVKGQDDDGGWNYGYKAKADVENSPNSDLSVAGWQIQALNAARHTGLTFPGVDATWKKIESYLKVMQGSDGSFGYRTPGGSWSLTGVGGLCLIVSGSGRTGEMKKAMDYTETVLKNADREYKTAWAFSKPVKYSTDAARVDEGQLASLYGAYYHNQVLFMKGGTSWRRWNEALQKELLPAQSPDGSFPQEASYEGAHGSSGAGAQDAPFYRTALCTLMMEVYYRYLPATEKRVTD